MMYIFPVTPSNHPNISKNLGLHAALLKEAYLISWVNKGKKCVQCI